MTAGGLTALAEEAARRWTLDASTLIHRLGAMAPGDTIVLVLASSRHRAEALAACEYLIDRLKTDVMLWKRERFADGRTEEHTAELQPLMRNSYANLRMKKNNT